ncbi:hypothetical protein [Streptococcus sanguinis]|uniref:hypothetical protein n=1 Tax=Streptococcus sanguinis TaxID=1305 RepID=UPI00066D59F6|nr:hypothetical protein [Streptococcus sanguinis]
MVKRRQILWLFLSITILVASYFISESISSNYEEVNYQFLSSNIKRKVRIRGKVISSWDFEDRTLVSVDLNNDENQPIKLIVDKYDSKQGINVNDNIEAKGISTGLADFGGEYPTIVVDEIIHSN